MGSVGERESEQFDAGAGDRMCASVPDFFNTTHVRKHSHAPFTYTCHRGHTLTHIQGCTHGALSLALLWLGEGARDAIHGGGEAADDLPRDVVLRVKVLDRRARLLRGIAHLLSDVVLLVDFRLHARKKGSTTK